ncbi:MAG TPA: hypothetical protein VHG08_10530 [Longimicrobium sp.]|nr:hypothetical protein [Longimicrobium sp.]
MTQRRPHPTRSAPAHTGRSPRGILLVTLLTLGCSAGEVTGPRNAAEPPPDDAMRVANLVIFGPEADGHTRHRFLYDDAGRLERVDFYNSQPGDGSPVRRAHYTEHSYAGSVLTETNYFRLAETGKYVNWRRINYTYDRLGYLVRETLRVAVPSTVPGEPGTVHKSVTRFRYDDQGRLAERLQDNGERIVYRYSADGTLAVAEYRSPGAQTQRRTFSYAGGRNPFYRRVAHANSLIVPLGLETMLLAPANLARLENRVDPSPTLVASLTQEYQTDSDGRPLHIRQRFINDIHPGSQGEELLFTLGYEPASR